MTSQGHLRRKKVAISGLVEGVGEFNAYLHLDVGLHGKGLVNLAHLSSGHLTPPLTDHVKVGQRLTGLYLGVDRRTGCHEISPLKLRLLQERPLPGLRRCVVKTATEFGAELDSPEGSGHLLGQEQEWSQYQILFRCGVLEAGFTLLLYCSGKIDDAGRTVYRFPRWQIAKDTQTPLHGELIAWRLNALDKKEHALRNILYVHTGSGYLYRVEANDILDLESQFELGQEVTITQGEKVKSGIPMGRLCRTKDDAPSAQLEVGTKVTAKVFKLMGAGGAMVVVSDGVLGFLHGTSVLPSKEPIDSVLKVGDWVEAEVATAPDPEHGRAGLKFVRLVRDSLESTRERNPLIDVRSEKLVGKRGGFRRATAFRQSVLAAYQHTCCACGSNYVVGGITCMEAAHVIPRGQRGADTLANGLCLCPIHHWAFDRGLIMFDEGMRVRVSEVAKHRNADWLTVLDGQEPFFPNGVRVSGDAIDWHRRNVFLKHEAAEMDNSAETDAAD